MKKNYYLCRRARFFDVLVVFFLASAITLSSCSGLYQLNKAIAYEIQYNKQQNTQTDLSVHLQTPEK